MIQGVSRPVRIRPLLCGEDGACWASGLGITHSRPPPSTGLSPTVSLAARVGEGRGAGREGKVETAADHLTLTPNDTKSC